MTTLLERQLNVFSIAATGVLLTLLVIFFVATPTQCRFGPAVALPYVRSAVPLRGSERDLSVFITAAQQYFVGSGLIESDCLLPDLQSIAERTPDRPIFMHVDPSVPCASVSRLLCALRDAGFSEIHIVTFEGTPLQLSLLMHPRA